LARLYVLVLFFSSTEQIYHYTLVVSAATLSADGTARGSERLEAAHRISSQIDALLGGWLGRGECVRTGWSFAPRQNSGRAAAAARCLYERAKRVVA
jgi:hypothetical protein